MHDIFFIPSQQLLRLLGSAAYREFDTWVSDITRVNAGLRPPDDVPETRKAVSQILMGRHCSEDGGFAAAQVVGATLL